MLLRIAFVSLELWERTMTDDIYIILGIREIELDTISSLSEC